MNKKFLISSLSTATLSALLLLNINGVKVKAANNNVNNEGASQSSDSQADAQANVQNAQNEVDKAEAEVSNKEQDLAQTQAANQAPIKVYNDQAKKVADAQSTVANKQTALAKAQEDAKQATPEKIAQTQRDLDAANTQYASDRTALTNANNEQSSKQTAYDRAKSAAQTAVTNVTNAQTALDAAKADEQTKRTAFNTAQTALTDVHRNTNYNKIIINSAFKTVINNAQNYLSENNASTLPSSLQTDIKNAGASLLTSNRYQSVLSDKNEIVDIANITGNQLENIRKFYLNLLNGLRSQLGYVPLKYNKSAMRMSDEVVRIYQNDNWDPETQGHDVPALDRAYNDAGLGGREEAMGHLKPGFVPDYDSEVQEAGGSYSLIPSDNSNEVTMDDIKNNLYGIVLNMLFNDAGSGWGHTMSLTHPGSKFMGLAISKYGNELTFHMNPVDPGRIEDASKFNQEDNLPLDDSDVAGLRHALDDAQSALTTATSAVTTAQGNYNTAVSEQSAKQTAEAAAKTALDSAKKAVSDLQSALNTDQTNINNLTIELNNLRHPQVAINAAQSALSSVQSALQSEQNQLSALKPARDVAQSKVNAAQAALDQAKSALNVAQNRLTAAQSTLDGLTHPNVIFGDNGVVVTANNQVSAFENSNTVAPVNNQDNSEVTAVNLDAVLHAGQIPVYDQMGVIIGQIQGNQIVHLINRLLHADKVFYRLENNNQWVSSADLDLKSEESLEPSITQEAPKNIKRTKKTRTRNLERKYRRITRITKKVTLVDKKGNKTKRTLKVGTNWKVFAKKRIKGKLYYRLGTQKQWALASHMRILKHSKF